MTLKKIFLNTTERAKSYIRGLLSVTAVITFTLILVPSHAVDAKDKFIFANGSAYDTMDPQVVFDVGRVAYRLNLYDGLMRWLDNPPKLNPWLAESYDISNDGTRYTFKLRNAVFHDGSPVEAKDVV